MRRLCGDGGMAVRTPYQVVVRVMAPFDRTANELPSSAPRLEAPPPLVVPLTTTTDAGETTGSGPTGAIAPDASDAAPVPIAFAAVIVNVYFVPLVRPPTVSGLLAPLAVCPPGEAVTA